MRDVQEIKNSSNKRMQMIKSISGEFASALASFDNLLSRSIWRVSKRKNYITVFDVLEERTESWQVTE